VRQRRGARCHAFGRSGRKHFWKGRKRKAPPKPWRHHRTPCHGDITPIAPDGQCFAITVSEQLGATILIEEYLAATAVELERRSATILATERLSARTVISERLICTITIVCCH